MTDWAPVRAAKVSKMAISFDQIEAALRDYAHQGALVEAIAPGGAIINIPALAIGYKGTQAAGEVTVCGAGDGERDHYSPAYGIEMDTDTGDILIKVGLGITLRVNVNNVDWVGSVLDAWHRGITAEKVPIDSSLWYYRALEETDQPKRKTDQEE